MNQELSKKRPIYIVSSVRGISPDERKIIQVYVDELSNSKENLVFDPYQHAPQDDSSGLNIILAELNFLAQIANSDQKGRVDFLWNSSSEGSRVDFGMAVALNLRLRLVKVFEKISPNMSQVSLQLIQEICQLQEQNLWPPQKNQTISINLKKLIDELKKIQTSQEVVVDWDTDMNSEKSEWQRIILGLALGSMISNPNLKIILGDVSGIIDPDQKSYPRAIQELQTSSS